MPIGTSLGAFYQDQFHQSASQWDPDRYDDNEMVLTPNQLQRNKELYDVEVSQDNVLGGLEVSNKNTMPFPDNNNPDTDFVNRFPRDMKPSGILNDIKPRDPVPQLQRRLERRVDNSVEPEADIIPIADIQLKNGMTITEEDINRAMDIGLSFSGGGLKTGIHRGPQVRKGANDNIKDIDVPGMTPVEQLARKLAEKENGKNAWDRIGGGGQEHYWRYAERALRTPRPPGNTMLDKIKEAWGVEPKAPKTKESPKLVPKQETVGKAALKYGDDLFEGSNHGFAFEKLTKKHPDIDYKKVKDGFMTSEGRFVSREEALEIAKKAKQLEKSPSKYESAEWENATGLLSEDLIKPR